MCFGSKLKGEDQSSRLYEHNDHDAHMNSRPFEPKPAVTPEIMSYPPPGYHQNQSQSQSTEIYSAPQGPPPRHQDEYQARARDYVAPPPGSPPSHFAPPPGPQPGHSQPYDVPPTQPCHDWQTAVPDTSLLPPPPALGNQRSSTNNATEEQAELGEIWCMQNPLTSPIVFPQSALEAIERGEIGVIRPRDYKGDLERPRPGAWVGRTKANSPDSCMASTIPLYSVMAHSPLRTATAKTIYYEVKISAKNRPEVSLAMGFGAAPYPTFRLPGWHRGCLAVHGDDGSKYINDRWGGKDFTRPFKAGETLGLGMTFRARDMNAPPSYEYAPAQTLSTNSVDVEIFFTRNGRRENSWNLHEEGDAQEDLPATGLEGFNDLYAMVGTFENVEFEIVFNRGEWMYQP